MLKKKGTKKRFSFIAVAVMTLVLLFAPASAQAATNPLADMPTEFSEVKYKSDTNMSMEDYVTPYYSSKVSIKVKSSNPKVAKVTGNSFYGTNWQTGKKGYAAGYMITPVSAGTAKIYVTVKVKGKSYSKTCKYRCYKWESPFTSLKIGSVNYQKRLNKNAVVHTKKNILSGKIYYKAKPGFKVKVWARYYANSKEKYPSRSKLIKSGQSLPKRTCSLMVVGEANGVTYSADIIK